RRGSAQVIIVDASALLAILLHEPERVAFRDKLRQATTVAMSPVNVWETLVRARSALGDSGIQDAEALLSAYEIEIVPIGPAEARAAVDAHARFGRRTTAGLNFGDCFAYALAKSRSAPLLYKGDDFGKTDVITA